MKLALIRHSITEGNLAGQYVGRTDQPLCAEGVALAARSRAAMPAVERVFCSPLARARQTAALLFPTQPAVVIPGLQECDFGIFEGMTYDQLSAREDVRAWNAHGYAGFPPSGGESAEAFSARCCAAFSTQLAALVAQEVASAAFVLHGGSIMALMTAFATPVRTFYEWQLQNCAGFLCEANSAVPALTLLAAINPEGAAAR